MKHFVLAQNEQIKNCRTEKPALLTAGLLYFDNNKNPEYIF